MKNIRLFYTVLGTSLFLAGCATVPNDQTPIGEHSIDGANSALNNPNYEFVPKVYPSWSNLPIETQPESNVVIYPLRKSPHARVIGRELVPDWRPKLYRVKKGDTLYSIALEHGYDYREVAYWNQLNNQSTIRIGQLLRLSPPPTANVRIPNVTEEYIPSQPESSTSTSPRFVSAKTKLRLPRTTVMRNIDEYDDERTNWVWPTQGKIISYFRDNVPQQKGIDMTGQMGQPVFAVASGKVVYSGSSLRGYGKLIIIKHNKTFLTAYAHNSEILFKEGSIVKKGQKIAAMGDSEADRVKLHFEVRRLGKPVDPLKYLPPVSQ